MADGFKDVNPNIHRHTGGLESQATETQWLHRIHRHTGGLENL